MSSGTGFTVQRVQVMSVAAAVATCDKSLGTLSSTGGNGKLGGALASPGLAASLATVSGQVIHAKAGSYAFSASNNVAGGRVTLASAVSLYGYETTRYDLGARPAFNAGAASMTCVTGGTNSVISGIEVTNTGANATVVGIAPGGLGLTDRCKVSACATGYNLAGSGRAFDCEAVSCTVGFSIGNTFALHACKASACTSYAFQEAAGSIVTLADCLAIGTTAGRGFAISATGTGTFVNCTSRGHLGANGRGFELNNRSELVNCLAADCANYGFFTGATTSLQVRLRNCAGYNNAAGNSNPTFVAAMVTGLIALSADPFVDGASGDFRPNATAGGGALLRGTGLPQAFPGYAAANAPDIGAYQVAASASTIAASTNLRGGFSNG